MRDDLPDLKYAPQGGRGQVELLPFFDVAEESGILFTTVYILREELNELGYALLMVDQTNQDSRVQNFEHEVLHFSLPGATEFAKEFVVAPRVILPL